MAQDHTKSTRRSPAFETEGRAVAASALPADGKLIHASPWRQQITVGFFVWVALGNLSVAVVAFTLGSSKGLALGVGSLLFAAFCLRAPLTGLAVEHEGIKVRTAVWTYHWSWREIEYFELKPRGYIPRLRIHLSDGRVKKARGFFARRPEEEERCQALFRGLQERLTTWQQE